MKESLCHEIIFLLWGLLCFAAAIKIELNYRRREHIKEMKNKKRDGL